MPAESQIFSDSLQFAEPWWFAVLAILPVLVALRVFAMLRGRARARSFVAPRLAGRLVLQPRRAAGWAVFALELLGIMALIFALARPQKGFTVRNIEVEGRNVLLAVDVSRSMLAIDAHDGGQVSMAGKPSRLELAKLAARDLVRVLPGERVGLIAFAGNAFQQVPLTVDHMAVRESLDQMNIYAIERGGTNLEAAIDTAIESFSKTKANQKALVLFTDGDELEGDALASAAEAKAAGITIFTIGLGSPDGSIIQYKSQRGEPVIVRDRNKEVVKTRLDVETLREIAELTGGNFINLRDGRITEKLASRLVEKLDFTRGESRSQRIPNELFQWPLGLGFVLLLLGYLGGPISRAVRNPVWKADSLAISSPPAAANALAVAMVLGLVPRADALTASDAATTFGQGDYEKAAVQYSELLENGDEPVRGGRWTRLIKAMNEKKEAPARLLVGRGAAFYEMGKYDEALDDFSKALLSPDTRLQEQSHYNLGNTHFRVGEALEEQQNAEEAIGVWNEAIDHYEGALALNPGLEQARTNIEITKKRIERLNQQQDQEQQDENQEQQDENQEQQDQEQQDQNQEQQDQEQQDQNQDQQDQDQDQDQQEGSESKENQSQEGEEQSSEEDQQEEGENQESQGGSEDQEQKEDEGPQGQHTENPDKKEGEEQSEEQQSEEGEQQEGKEQQQQQAEPASEGEEGEKEGDPVGAEKMVDPKTGYDKMTARQLLRALADDYKMQPLQRRKQTPYYYNDW